MRITANPYAAHIISEGGQSVAKKQFPTKRIVISAGENESIAYWTAHIQRARNSLREILAPTYKLYTLAH